jgi:hypothetical protein
MKNVSGKIEIAKKIKYKKFSPVSVNYPTF